MKSVSILGSGVVGMTVGKGLLKLGNCVVFFDIDEKKVHSLSLLGLATTSSIKKAIDASDISFVCVPTPLSKKGMDLSYVKSIVKSVASCLRHKNEYHLVVMKSTVPPKTTEEVVIPLLEKVSKKSCGESIGVCMNPEFLTEIHRSWSESDKFSRNFFTEERIVIGELDTKSGNMLADLYSSLNVPIIRTNLKTAEMIKFACNCALASRISYWNEIFYICLHAGVDSNVVARAAALDKRIGEYGTMHGKAFGGKCLPKDLAAFIQFSEVLGYKPKLLKAVQDVNVEIKADKGVRE